ncbi:hypothetical protein BDN71DRAFT_1442087 [Pleurotus eryngii]|uniref:Secreted protein n=1 Tax=Pleurotus eryngii TaxID=5323 RepID=A0A9P6A3M9_PLEER|nr:hypothetical protein BDN71DRAFT_1442087 [Pleurotus eryngii]
MRYQLFMFLLGPLQRGLVLLSPVDLQQQLFTPPYLTPNLPSILCQPSFTFHHVGLRENVAEVRRASIDGRATCRAHDLTSTLARVYPKATCRTTFSPATCF